MNGTLQQIRDLQSQAQLDRKKGEALRKLGREKEALEAFVAGEAKLRQCLVILDGLNWSQSSDLAAQRAETLGSLGGMLRRMNKNDEAFEHYRAGAAVEREFRLADTYNRVNELKYMLRSGRSTLRELEPRIRNTADSLEKSLSNAQAQQLSDSAWSWADLGDCRALLGELDAADRAYQTFIKKADIKSPSTTLDVLRSIAGELKINGDPDAGRVCDAVSILEMRVRGQ